VGGLGGVGYDFCRWMLFVLVVGGGWVFGILCFLLFLLYHLRIGVLLGKRVGDFNLG